ncbi:MAG TPA: hypothetical protein VKQ70_02805, partial [Caulobacteraceae bacterium]|nr:hypothetical protein [Caulobacteraceae bacterium]
SAACGATGYGLWWAAQLVLTGFALHSLGLAVAIVGAVSVYAGAGYVLRIGETHEAVALLQRRLLRRRKAA